MVSKSLLFVQHCRRRAAAPSRRAFEFSNSQIVLGIAISRAQSCGSTAYPSNQCLYSILYGPLDEHALLLLFCLLRYPLAVFDNDPVRISNVEPVNGGF